MSVMIVSLSPIIMILIFSVESFIFIFHISITSLFVGDTAIRICDLLYYFINVRRRVIEQQQQQQGTINSTVIVKEHNPISRK